MLPRLVDIAAAQAGVFTRAQAMAAGYTADEIRTRLRAETWSRVRHGVYQGGPSSGARETHLRQCWAATLVAGSTSVISGPSACVVHGVDLVAVPNRVHLATPHSRSARRLDVRRMELGVDEVVEVDGLRVTSLARTAVETARVLDYGPAVVAVDAVLRRARLEVSELERMLGDRDVARARRVLRFADGRSESVGESLARLALEAAGLPRPELQVPFIGRRGRYRVDFYWPEQRTIAEFDGRSKYGPGADGVRTVWDEKRREDDLRDLGNAFVRFGAADLDEPQRLRRMVETAFFRGAAFND